MKKIFVLAGMALLASCADKGTDAAGKINQPQRGAGIG